MKNTKLLIALLTLLSMSNLSYAEEGKLSFSGYMDARLSSYTDKSTNGNPESGWGIEDGAFYLNYEIGKNSVVVDMPFRRYKVADNTNPPAGVSASSPTSTLAVGYDKAQVFGKHKASETFELNIGQFDTIYGVELNDSKDRTFGKTGLVYDYLLPVTHTGILAVYTMGSTAFKMLSANSNNKGSLGSNAEGDNSYEYGLALSYADSNYRAQLGYMTRPILKADSSAFAARTLVDVTMGATFGQFSIDLEYGLLTNPNKNTLTAGDNADAEAAGKGLMALLNYKMSDSLNLGVRYESLTDDPSGASLKSINSTGLSIQHQVSPKYQIRAEYVTYASETIAGVKSDAQRVNFANLFYF